VGQLRRTTWIAVVVVLVVVLAGALSFLVLTTSSKSPGPGLQGVAVCPSTSGGSAGAANWTTYHGDNVRSGVEAAGNITAVENEWASPTMLDGQVYAEPLVCGDALFVATENDSVYAINSSSGKILWHTHLGTPVPGSALPCGDIDPSGITGTPVIDVATGILYVVAFVLPAQHDLFGLNVVNGSVVSHVAVDPAGSVPSAEQERGALALANGKVYIPFGGLFGDCAQYHGWVVGVPLSGSGGLVAYQVPTHREGGIWGSAGIAVAANGNLFVATGNGDSTGTFDYGDSVIELSPSLGLVGYFAPTNWAALNAGDTDLGSTAPTLLPNGDIFQIGKAGVGYLLSQSDLGGIGGQLALGNVCGGSYGGTAHVGLLLLVPCVDGLVAVTASTSNFSVTWHAGSFDAGPPIVTGSVVWTVDLSSAELMGFNLTTGAPLFSEPLGAVDHFITPTASPGSIIVGAGDQLLAFSLT
jgi:outer membrane protein assembly factor BamB